MKSNYSYKYNTPEEILIDTIKQSFNFGNEDAEAYAKHLRETGIKLYKEMYEK